mgnify:CR=1 FL=1
MKLAVFAHCAVDTITLNGTNYEQIGGSACYCGITARQFKFDVDLYTKFGPNFPKQYFTENKINFGNSESQNDTTKFAISITGADRTLKLEHECDPIDYTSVSADGHLVSPIYHEITNDTLKEIKKDSNFLFVDPQGFLRQKDSQNNIVLEKNDIERTIAILDQHANDIACILIDPVPHRVGLIQAHSDFIEAMYNWTRRNGALLVFDEVVTLRVNYSGTQNNYSVKPDLTAMGKMIGGGFPVGALAGRGDIMKVLDPSESKLLFPHSGTFSANPITMTAGRVAMELFDEDAVLKLNALTQKAISQIKEAIKIADVPVSITGAGSMFRIHLTATPPTTYREAFQTKEKTLLIKKLLDYLFINERIMMVNTCTCMFSTALKQKEVDILSAAILNGFKLIKSELENI